MVQTSEADLKEVARALAAAGAEPPLSNAGARFSAVDPALATLHDSGAMHLPATKAHVATRASYDEGHAKRKMCLTLAFVGTEFQGESLLNAGRRSACTS